MFDRFIPQTVESLETDNKNGNGDGENGNGENGNGNGNIEDQSDIKNNETVQAQVQVQAQVAKPDASCACRIKQAVKGQLCFTNRKLRKYAKENALLKYYVDKLLKQSDEPNNYHLAYRKRLSNKYYPVKPALAHTDHNVLTLRDDDFSTKTFSESKFLAPTKNSSYYGQDVHYGSYLCDDMYPYNDPKVVNNYQTELAPQVRLY